MKKVVFLLIVVSIFVFSCKSTDKSIDTGAFINPGKGPEVALEIPELFNFDPDAVENTIEIAISVTHPVPIRDWNISIHPNRGPRQADPQRTRTRRIFLEQAGRGTVPDSWTWNGRGTNGEMIQSATEYSFILTVNDVFNNPTVTEGVIFTDIIVRREGDKLRMVVPSIIFPPDQSDLGLVTDEDDVRRNTRVLRLIARALNRFEDYKITVEGHANPTTRPNSAQRNTENPILRRLSLERAQAVINYLVENNDIDRRRLTATGIGGDRTVAAWDDAEENWKNRRVEFILEK